MKPPGRQHAPLRGLAGVAVALGIALGCGEPPAPAPPGAGPNVLLVTLDTTRADRLGSYGYHRATSPALDRLVEDSVLYTRAYSTSSWTLPAHASLFTGKIPFSHGARYDPEGPLVLAGAIGGIQEVLSLYRARGLAPGERTLAAILAEAGYRTGAIVAGPWLKRVFGLDAGFEHYDDDGITAANGRDGREVTDRAIRWLEAQRGERFFLFLNYFDAHAPYQPAKGFEPATLFPDEPIAPTPGDLYDAEIRYVDHQLGRLLDHLRATGLLDRTWVVVTADHGELLGEHGLKVHGRFLWEEEVRVPLVIRPPGGVPGGRRVAELIQVTDVLPLVLSELGIDAPADIQGRHPRAAGDPIVAELYPLPLRGDRGDVRAFLDGRYKFIWNAKGYHRLFDLESDPGEARSLIRRERERAEAMQAELDRYLAGLTPAGDAGPGGVVDADTREALQSLGYLEDAP